MCDKLIICHKNLENKYEKQIYFFNECTNYFALKYFLKNICALCSKLFFIFPKFYNFSALIDNSQKTIDMFLLEIKNTYYILRKNTYVLNAKLIRKNKGEKITKNHLAIKQCHMCVICLQNFKTNEYIRILPYCSHIFHRKCIDSWFIKNKHFECPLCRNNFDKDAPSLFL